MFNIVLRIEGGKVMACVRLKLSSGANWSSDWLAFDTEDAQSIIDYLIETGQGRVQTMRSGGSG